MPKWVSPSIVLFLLLLFGSSVYATEILLLGSNEKLLQSYSKSLQKSKTSNRIITVSTSLNPKVRQAELCIVLGSDLLKEAISLRGKRPTVSLLTSKPEFHAALRGLPKSAVNATAIYAEPDPHLQAKLIRSIYAWDDHTAVILSAQTREKEQELLAAFKNTGVKPVFYFYDGQRSLRALLHDIKEDNINSIFAIPDETLFNRETVREIIITAYKNRQAIIGFSPSLVKAGAIATVYTTKEQIISQINDLIETYSSTQKLPQPSYSKYIDIYRNNDVARSMNVAIPEQQKLIRLVQGGIDE